jgi:transposase InsO family protein
MKVSRSAFYAYRRGASYQKTKRQKDLDKSAREYFYLHRRRYGTRRIAAELETGRAAVRAAMRRESLQARRRTLIKRNAIIHTDRGSQYAAVEFRRLLYIYGFRQSMSAKGNCYDNAQAESFFSRFKAELIEDGIFESLEEARTEIFSYIVGYYNRIRRHSALEYKSPLEFEKQLRIKNLGRRDSFLC